MNTADRKRVRAIDQEIDDILSSYFEHERVSKFDLMRIDDLEAEKQRLLPPNTSAIDWEKRERIARELGR